VVQEVWQRVRSSVEEIIVSGGLGIPFPGKADRGPIPSDRKPVEVVGSSEMVSYSNDDRYR
jgi:hypothetical protein